MPIPNHCIECDKPTTDILCNKCKEKEMEITSKQANYLLTCVDIAVSEGFTPNKEEAQIVQQLHIISKENRK